MARRCWPSPPVAHRRCNAGRADAPVLAVQRSAETHRYLIAVRDPRIARRLGSGARAGEGRRHAGHQRAEEPLRAAHDASSHLLLAVASATPLRCAWSSASRMPVPISRCTTARVRRRAPRSASASPWRRSPARGFPLRRRRGRAEARHRCVAGCAARRPASLRLRAEGLHGRGARQRAGAGLAAGADPLRVLRRGCRAGGVATAASR